MNAPLRPPRLAEALAEALVADPALRDAALGDLAEEFVIVAASRGAGAARSWYWSQVARSAPSLAALGTTAGLGRSRAALTWLRLVASVVLGYALLAVFVPLLDFWMMARLGNPSVIWLMPVASLVSGMSSAFVAGYVTALVGGRARILSGAALGVFCIALSALMLWRGRDGSPLWYQVALMVIVLPMVMVGTLLRARHAARRQGTPRAPLDPATPEARR